MSVPSLMVKKTLEIIVYKQFKQRTRNFSAREAARQRLFLFLDYFWEEKKALCFNKPFFALFSCYRHCHLKRVFLFQEARAQ